jgi:hypothetical protein
VQFLRPKLDSICETRNKEENMKLSMRAAIYGLLVVSILVGAILSGCSSQAEPTPSQQTPTQATPTTQSSQGQDDRIEVVYFHRANR